jgi:hypothetical protein
MTPDHNEETEWSGLPDTDKLRRFSLGVGVALLIYAVAGGHIGQSLQTVLIPIVHFDRPQFLLGALVLASIYSTSRYWYYGIRLSQTRGKIREYLRKEGSVLVFVGDEMRFTQELNVQPPNHTRKCQGMHYGRLHPDWPRSDFHVITHGQTEPELIEKQIAAKLEKYFPGLKAEDISFVPDKESIGRAQVFTTSQSTDRWCWLEEVELRLPIIVNAVAWVSLLGCAAWSLFPLLGCVVWPLILKLV